MRNYVYPSVKHVMNTTKFKYKERAEAAIKTLKWLDGGKSPPKEKNEKIEFNMEKYIEFDDCGTVCCIGGAISLFTKNFRPSYIMHIDFEDVDNPNDELRMLFYANNITIYLMGQITKFEAAVALRKYLKTGKVDWSHLKISVLENRYDKRKNNFDSI